ncbi:MAG: hypothetical protein IT376_19915 [Polyangiaceae bacterium]|nr:hypothetical protein [Polyangiaceae bacterium]
MKKPVSLVAALAALTVASAASAEPMDPAIERLVLDPACHDDGDGPLALGQYNDSEANLAALERGPGLRRWCAPDHAAFKKLVGQYGFALAPTAMHSARTTGFGGFHLSMEMAITDIDEGKRYWKEGSQGKVDPSTNRPSRRNPSPATALTLYTAKLRKSFGFGLELTAAVGFMPETSIVSGGADTRLSLLEGFRSGLPGILPDVAVGAGVRTITGTPQFQLTTVGLDTQVSKPLPIADSSILTPWVGYQYLWIFGDSGLVDLTPGTDPLGYCNYAGQNVPGNADPEKTLFDGQPVCQGGSPLDFNNNVVFNQARLERQRLLFGLNYRYEMVSIGAQFITDIVDPADAQVGDEKTTISVPVRDANGQITGYERQKVKDDQLLEGAPRQWTLVFELGTMF